MTALTLNHEFGLMRVRFRRTLSVSILLHVMLFLALILSRHLAPPDERLVEITWLEPDAVARVTEAVSDPIAVQAPPPPPQISVREKLGRNAEQAEQMRANLDALRPSSVASQALASLPTTSAALRNTAVATMAPVVRKQTPAQLNRGPGTHQPAVALTRGPTSSHKAAAVVAELPTPGQEPAAARAAAGAAAVRNLGGATLTGIVADRRIIQHTMPVYPSWAMTQAVEATVTLDLVVLPDGTVKPNVMVQKTAGYEDFDRNAVAAIRQWRFEPLTGSDAREQWGTITFRYRLHN
jgi:TonB family protein